VPIAWPVSSATWALRHWNVPCVYIFPTSFGSSLAPLPVFRSLEGSPVGIEVETRVRSGDSISLPGRRECASGWLVKSEGGLIGTIIGGILSLENMTTKRRTSKSTLIGASSDPAQHETSSLCMIFNYLTACISFLKFNLFYLHGYLRLRESDVR
jgi:hypothetical protein